MGARTSIDAPLAMAGRSSSIIHATIRSTHVSWAKSAKSIIVRIFTTKKTEDKKLTRTSFFFPKTVAAATAK